MKANIKHFVLITLLGLISAAACNPLFPNSEILSGTSWELVRFNQQIPIPGSNITANFENGDLQGNAGCNHYFGTYQIRGDSILIKELAWTEMACLNPEGLMEQELKVMRLLSNADRFSVSTTTLSISTKNNVILEFNLKED